MSSNSQSWWRRGTKRVADFLGFGSTSQQEDDEQPPPDPVDDTADSVQDMEVDDDVGLPQADDTVTKVSATAQAPVDEEEYVRGVDLFVATIKKMKHDLIKITTPALDEPACFACADVGPAHQMARCSGPCDRTFHPACVGHPGGGEFQCEQCSKDGPACLICSRPASPQNPLVKCAEAAAGGCALPWFHRGCVTALPNHHVDQREVTCPAHACASCASRGRAERNDHTRLVRCMLCPAAFHDRDACIPAGSEVISRAFVICPAHAEETGRPMHAHWCFGCGNIHHPSGPLRRCKHCPASYHAGCSGVPDAVAGQEIKCPRCTGGEKICYGDLVWVKQRGYRWWPAKVVRTKDVPHPIYRTPEVGEFVVQFFGWDPSHNYAWVRGNQCIRFGEAAPPNSSGRLVGKFGKAVEEAMEFQTEEQRRSQQAQAVSRASRSTAVPNGRMDRPDYEAGPSTSGVSSASGSGQLARKRQHSGEDDLGASTSAKRTRSESTSSTSAVSLGSVSQERRRRHAGRRRSRS